MKATVTETEIEGGTMDINNEDLTLDEEITLEEVRSRFKEQPMLKELFKITNSIPEPKQTYVLRIILSRIQQQNSQIKQ